MLMMYVMLMLMLVVVVVVVVVVVTMTMMTMMTMVMIIIAATCRIASRYMLSAPPTTAPPRRGVCVFVLSVERCMLRVEGRRRSRAASMHLRGKDRGKISRVISLADCKSALSDCSTRRAIKSALSARERLRQRKGARGEGGSRGPHLLTADAA